MRTRRRRRAGARRGATWVRWAALVTLCLMVCGAVRGPVAEGAPAPAPAPPLASAQELAISVAGLHAIVQASPVLSPAVKALYGRRLDALARQLSAAEGLTQQIAAQTALLQLLVAQRAVARAGLDRLQNWLRNDLRALGSALDLSTAPVSVTAQTLGVTATATLTQAHLDLQAGTSRLVLNVRTSAHVLGLLALNTRAWFDTQRLGAHLTLLAWQVHLGVMAIMRDLRVLVRSDPSAASDVRSGLASGLTSALATLSDTLTGALDARESSVRLRIADLQAQLTRLLSRAAVMLGALQHDVLASLVAAAPLTVAQQRHAALGLDPAAGSLRDAAAVNAQLASRLADLGVVQDAQARIDREVQKAQADLDGILARADAALQGRLRSDVTVAITSTEETVHVHLASIDVGALVRDLDFNVQLGLALLQIAALHAEVVPSTHNYKGPSRTTITGVDMLLQLRLRGLQARIRTDVAAVRAAQEQESAAVRARIAALRSTLTKVLAPLVERYQADVTRLQSALTRDLAAANRSLHWTRLSLTALMHLKQLRGQVIAQSMVALHRAPTASSAVAGWVAPGAWLPLVGYVWGWTVRNPHTGVSDARWYVVYHLRDERGYLYVPAALLKVSALPGSAPPAITPPSSGRHA